MLDRRQFIKTTSAAAVGSLGFYSLPSVAVGLENSRNAKNMVSTVHPIATDAGVEALRRGGNAVDAAIAAALTLGVVDSYNSGIGGGCFILIRKSDGTALAIDGRETAPQKATRDMYVRNGKPDTTLSQDGPLAVGVPGALAAYDLARAQAGKLLLSQLLAPGLLAADTGFPLNKAYARSIESEKEILKRYPGSLAQYFDAQQNPISTGSLFRQPDLARTYRQISEQGIEWFYQGEFAERCGEWMSRHGGILSKADFANYRPIVRDALQTTYRDYSIIGFPPPSSGGVHVAQMLNMLERFNVREIYERKDGTYEHLMGEVMRLAFADRAFWLGDSDFVPVPRGLIDREYALKLAETISLEKRIADVQHGLPPEATTNTFRKHTTHIAAADSDGNWVGITATINTTFGSKVIVPGLGVILNNEMDDFAIAPGVPNAFGLVGAEANAVAAGKRPLSSMCPTIILEDGKPRMTIGAAGGPRIISQVLGGIVRHLDLDMPLDDALNAPRIHHQWSPNKLYLSNSTPEKSLQRLKELGHDIELTSSMAVVQAISIDQLTGDLHGVHDASVEGKASGIEG